MLRRKHAFPTSGGDKFMTEKEFVRDKIRKFQFHTPLTLFESRHCINPCSRAFNEGGVRILYSLLWISKNVRALDSINHRLLVASPRTSQLSRALSPNVPDLKVNTAPSPGHCPLTLRVEQIKSRPKMMSLADPGSWRAWAAASLITAVLDTITIVSLCQNFEVIALARECISICPTSHISL